MSLLSPETLHLFLCPSEVLAVSRSGWRRQLVQTRRYPLTRNADHAWQDALAGFSLAVREFECARARVVLSHHFVQFRLLAARVDLANEAEFQALARLEFSNAFGALSQDWHISLSDEPPGVPRIAAALPQGLWDGLISSAGATNVRLLGVKPYLAVVADAWSCNLSATDCSWLMLHEPGRICVAAHCGAIWRWVRHMRVGEDWHLTLSELLQAEAHLSGLQAPLANVTVCAPTATPHEREWLCKQGFRLLEQRNELGYLADRDGPFTPAWLG